MPVRLRCPGCEAVYQLPDTARGKTVRCKGCQKTFKVPAAPGALADKISAKKPALQAAAGGPPAGKPGRDGAAPDAPKRPKVKTLPPDDDEEPVAPRPRGKKSKTSKGRKNLPVPMLVGIGVAAVVLIAVVVVAVVTMSPGENPKLAKAKAAMQSPPSSPPPELQPPQDPGQFQQAPTDSKKNGGKGKGPKGKPGAKAPMEEPVTPDFAVSYVQHIKPLLTNYCGNCHNPTERKGGASFETYADILKGGRGGQQLLVKGDAAKSLLVRRVEEGKMPPPREGKELSAAERGLLIAWVAAGANDDSSPGGAMLPGVRIEPFKAFAFRDTALVAPHAGTRAEYLGPKIEARPATFPGPAFESASDPHQPRVWLGGQP